MSPSVNQWQYQTQWRRTEHASVWEEYSPSYLSACSASFALYTFSSLSDMVKAVGFVWRYYYGCCCGGRTATVSRRTALYGHAPKDGYESGRDSTAVDAQEIVGGTTTTTYNNNACAISLPLRRIRRTDEQYLFQNIIIVDNKILRMRD